MNLKELAHVLKTRNGITYSTLYGWLTRGYLPKKDTYSEKDIEEIAEKIPYCIECGKRLPMETTLHVCSKCNMMVKTACLKCGAPVHKYFDRRLVENPICHKCSLNEPEVISAVRSGCCRSWAFHSKERSEAIAEAVQSPTHREKMRKLTANVWKRTDYKEKMRVVHSARQALIWENTGARDFPHAVRLSLHVFRCKHCGNEYVDQKLNNTRQPSVNYCPHCPEKFTGPEKIIEAYLKNENIKYMPHWRPKWLSGKELDFYLPEYHIAIEVDGVFYHCEAGGKDRRYHLEKTEACEENKIQLIHIWDSEIQNKWPIVLDRLKALLHKNNEKIGARKCQIHEIESNAAREFLDKNHIQGFTPCNVYYGLFYKETLVGVAAFHKGRTANSGEWELARYATILGLHVSGGMSRIITRFYESHPGSSIISYADRRWTSACKNAYSQFKYIRKTPPSYYYVYHSRIYRREKFMIKRLAKNPITASIYSPGMSERECCEKVPGLFKIWDCGQLLYHII